MGVDEGNLQVIDKDVTLEDCPITISLRYILTGSNYGVFSSHYCVFFPFIMDVKFVGCTSRGHTGGRPHGISHPPYFCGISYLTFVTAGVRDGPASGCGIYMGFKGLRIRKKGKKGFSFIGLWYIIK